MNLACQFQHLLAKPIPILPAFERAQPPARAGAAGAGIPICPCLVLAEPYHIEDACERLNRMTDGEVREGTIPRQQANAGYPRTLAAGNSFCAGGECGQAAIPLAKRDEVVARTNLAQDSIQLPESEYLETICDAIELADSRDDFRLIRAAIARVYGAVNRQSLRMMVELREKEVAHD